MIKNTMSNFMVNSIYLNRVDRITYDGRRWLPGIIDSSVKPNSRVVMLMSRQVGKSTNVAGLGLAKNAKFENYRILYVAPEKDQASKYSRDKVEPIIKNSPIISQQQQGLKNVFEKEFVKGGRYYIKYAKHNPDSCRGLTVDEINYDEIQDQDLDEIEPVINESLFTSKHKIRIYGGTPKSYSNPAHHKFMESNQNEWLIKCSGCRKYNNLGIRNIGLKGPICYSCGKLLDVDDGVWVSHNPKSDMLGFHIGQIHLKLSHQTEDDWKEILLKVEKYPEHKLLNEVFGVSADTDEQPISEKDLYQSCDPDMPLRNEPVVDMITKPTFAGIDWGHGKYATAIAIGQYTGMGKFRIIYGKKYIGREADQDMCIPDLVRVLTKYRVSKIHCDHGGGFALNSILSDAIKRVTNKDGLVTANYWSGSAKAKNLNWTTDPSNKIPFITINKSKYISNFINEIKSGRFTFFRWSDLDPAFTSDFYNVRKEVSDSSDNDIIRYTRMGPDDFFQAVAYCKIVADLALGKELGKDLLSQYME
ncbi:MAG: phage terminase large subunit family protein [Weeksellaceae bacterium]